MTQNIAKTTKGPIEYRLEGNGPTVLVLNGSHCTQESRLSHEGLTEYGFSVLIPSRPGYDSTPSEVGRTAQEAADAMAALLDTLQISTVDVIGISGAGEVTPKPALRSASRPFPNPLRFVDMGDYLMKFIVLLFSVQLRAQWQLCCQLHCGE